MQLDNVLLGVAITIAIIIFSVTAFATTKQ